MIIIFFFFKIGNEAAVILDFQASLSCKNLLFVSPQTINRSAITTRSLRQAQGHGQTKPRPRQAESTAQLSALLVCKAPTSPVSMERKDTLGQGRPGETPSRGSQPNFSSSVQLLPPHTRVSHTNGTVPSCPNTSAFPTAPQREPSA